MATPPSIDRIQLRLEQIAHTKKRIEAKLKKDPKNKGLQFRLKDLDVSRQVWEMEETLAKLRAVQAKQATERDGPAA